MAITPLGSRRGVLGSGPMKKENKATAEAPKSGSNLLDFEGMTEALETGAALSSKRRGKYIEYKSQEIALNEIAARETYQVNERARQSAQQSRDQQLKVMGDMDATLAKGQEAIRLSNSQNPLDRLQLWMLQQSDPTYTREGNSGRLDYLTGASSAVGQREAVKQAGFMDEAVAIEEKKNLALLSDASALNLIIAQEQMGQEAIQASLDASAARAQMITQRNTIQETAVSTMTDDQVALAEQAAKASPTHSVNISGVEIPEMMLTNRVRSLADRRFLEQSQQFQRVDYVLSNKGPDEVKQLITESADSGFAIVDGVQISTARLQDRMIQFENQDYNRQIQGLSLQGARDNLAAQTKKYTLENMSMPDLQRIWDNGGIDAETGLQYPKEMMSQVMAMNRDEQTRRVQDEVRLATLADPMGPIASQSQYLDTIKAPPGSPLERQIKKQKQVLNVAASQVNSEDPIRTAVAEQTLAGSIETTEEAINQQAKMLAGNDKDVEAALGYSLRGLPIPEDVVITGITNALVKRGVSPVKWLDSRTAGMLSSVYWDEVARLTAEYNATGSKPGAEVIQAEAAAKAIEQVTNMIGGEMQPSIEALQFTMSDNPLKGSLTPAQFADVTKRANDAGVAQYASENKYNAEQMASINMGTPWPGPGEAPAPGLFIYQDSALHMELEKIKPGLGEAYVAWYTGENNPIQRTIDGITAAATQAKSMQEAVKYSMILPNLQNVLADRATSLNLGQSHAYTNELYNQHANFVTFGGDPTAKQAYLLQSDKSLSDTERQQAFSLIIQPLIDQAVADGKNGQETTVFIENNLRSMRPEDPVKRALLTKIMTNRDAALGTVDDFIGANPAAPYGLVKGMFDFGNPMIAPMAGVDAMMGGPVARMQGEARFNQGASNYDWFKKLKVGQ